MFLTQIRDSLPVARDGFTLIFTVTDPRDNSVFHVGRTKNAKTAFTRIYYQQCGQHCRSVVGQLRAANLKPVFAVVADVRDDLAPTTLETWKRRYTTTN